MAATLGKRKATAIDTLPPVCGAAFVVSITMYPVDVVRALCMSSPGTSPSAALRGFLAAHGAMGFVKQGLVAEVSRAMTSRSVKFFMQPICHEAIYGVPETRGTPTTKGIAGAVATIPEVLAISPLENIKLAAQLDKEKKFNGTADIAKHLVRTRGVFGGLYIGVFGMQCRQCLWTGGFFYTLDMFKGAVQGAGVSNAFLRDVVAGFGAGAFGTGLCCWADVVRSVVQKKEVALTFDSSVPRGSALRHLNPAVFFKEVAAVYGSKGIGGLYAGVGPKMVHLGGGGALLAVFMPRFKAAWFDFRGLH